MDLLMANPDRALIIEPVTIFETVKLYSLGMREPNLAAAVKLAISFDLKGTPLAS
jgi:hypothetical protein